MPDPIWPATVSSAPLQGSYGEQFQSNLTKFQPDVGPPSVTRRSILKATRIECVFRMTQVELDDFLDWFHDDLEDGSLAFEWTNPIYGQALRYRFDPANPPRWEVAGFAGASGVVFHVRVAAFRLADATVTGDDGGGGANWILETGIWDDNNVWIDSALWIDGETEGDIDGPGWVLATGVWDDDETWADDENWLDA